MLKKVLAAGLLTGGAFYYWKTTSEQSEGFGGGVVETVTVAAETVADFVSGSFMRVSNMKNLSSGLLGDRNVQAFLRVIRTGEGTADAGGYSRLYGGAQFSGFADHPRKKVTAGRWTSTAAGAYQFLESTWDETKSIMGLKDFSPTSQDMGALGRIAARNALADVLAGRFDSAVRKCALEWASLPGSPYGQPVISWERARKIYASAGGVNTSPVLA